MLKIVNLIKWLSIIIGAGGAMFSAYMHFKIQNAALVTPIKTVDEKVNDNGPVKVNNKITVEELDPVKLMNQNETTKVQMKA